MESSKSSWDLVQIECVTTLIFHVVGRKNRVTKQTLRVVVAD